MIANSNPNSKAILIDLINLLRGKEKREKILAKVATNISHSSLEEQRRTSTRWKIILPVIFGLGALVILTITLSLYMYINLISHEPCSVQNLITLNETEKGPPVDIVIDPKTNLAYAAYPNSNTILAINCNKEKLTGTFISIDGSVRKLAADPTTNKIYAIIPDTNSISVFDSNNDLDLGVINEMFDEFMNGDLDDILYDRPEYGIPQKTTVIPTTVDVNTNANGIINSKTGKTYISSTNNSDIIHVKNSKGDTIKDITGLGTSTRPNSLIENPNTNKTYVINIALPKVSVIDSETDSLLKNISVGTGPIDIAIDYSNNKTYVANQISSTISIIDGNKDQVVKTLPIAPVNNNKLQSIAVDSKTHLLYLGFLHNDGTGSISILNPVPYNDSYIQVSQSPIDMDFNRNTSKLYVTEYNNKSVAVIDTKNDTLKRVSLGESNLLPFNIAVNPNSNKKYVVNITPGNNDSSIVSVINSSDTNSPKNIPFPFRVYDIAIDPSLNKVYIIGSDKNQSYLSVIDGQNDTATKPISLSFSPSDIAVNSNTSNIYLANNNNWSIMMIENKSNNILNNKSEIIPLNIPPESIVVDPAINNIYVTSYSKPSSSKQESFLDPTAIALPRLTQIQVINGSNNIALWKGQTMKLDPRYGDIILNFNPKNHDLLATSLSTDTIQSWNITQAQNAIQNLSGVISGVKQLSAGIDYTQVALNNEGDKLYIANPALNAIKVENVSKAF